MVTDTSASRPSTQCHSIFDYISYNITTHLGRFLPFILNSKGHLCQCFVFNPLAENPCDWNKDRRLPVHNLQPRPYDEQVHYRFYLLLLRP